MSYELTQRLWAFLNEILNLLGNAGFLCRTLP